MKKHPVFVVFLIVQFLGVACLTLWERLPSRMGAPLWGTAVIALLPGNFLGGWIVEGAFWHKGLSLTVIGVLSLAVALIINAVIWFTVVKAIGVMRRHKLGG